jgi:octaprenyl-diphosphate synthase
MVNVSARDALLRLGEKYQLPRVREGLKPVADSLARDLVAMEEQVRQLMAGDRTTSHTAAQYLIESGGKRVRPMVCMLAARCFPPYELPAELIDLSMVTEAAHNSTLLHDDVIDSGEMRRGRPAPRVLFGNGASVLGGDLMLIQALRLIDEAGVRGLMTSMISVLDRMITAEAFQLENRGRVDLARDEYFAIIDGKTASLFEWAMEAGARAAGAPETSVAALVQFGRGLGYAFQLLDDLLDLTQDPETLGKGVLVDVAGGTLTYPILLALEGRPELARRLAAASGATESPDGDEEVPDSDDDPRFFADLLSAVDASAAVAQTRLLIAKHTEEALAALGTLADTPASRALGSMAKAFEERAR